MHQNFIGGSRFNDLIHAMRLCKTLEQVCICTHDVRDQLIDMALFREFLLEQKRLRFFGLISNALTIKEINSLTTNRNFRRLLSPYLCLRISQIECKEFLRNIPHLIFISIINHDPWAMRDELWSLNHCDNCDENIIIFYPILHKTIFVDIF